MWPHDGDDLVPRRHKLAGFGRPPTDDAVERGTDHRVPQIALCKLHCRNGTLLTRDRLRCLRLKNAELQRSRLRLCASHDDGGIGLAGSRDCLLIRLARGPSRMYERPRPRRLRNCPCLLRLRLGHACLRGIDRRLLLGQLSLCGLRRGTCLGCLGLGLLQARPPVAGIEQDQRLAGVDGLVVSHQDGCNAALDPRAQQRDVALDVGVVGALDEPSLGEPPCCACGPCHDDGDCRQSLQSAKPKAGQGPALAH